MRKSILPIMLISKKISVPKFATRLTLQNKISFVRRKFVESAIKKIGDSSFVKQTPEDSHSFEVGLITATPRSLILLFQTYDKLSPEEKNNLILQLENEDYYRD